MYTIVTTLSYRKHKDDMSWRECERRECMHKKQKMRVVYPTGLRDKDFHIWFLKAMLHAMGEGTEEVQQDLRALMLPPSD